MSVEPQADDGTADDSLGRAAKIDFSRVKTALNQPIGLPSGAKSSEQLEELADDMLRLQQQLQGMQASLGAVHQRIDALESISQAGRAELQSLRGEMHWERRAWTSLHAFEAIATPLDQFRLMHNALSDHDDPRFRDQLQAVVHTLDRLVRSLGMEAFQPEPGQPFNPQQMVCCGFLPGTPGMVVKLLKPGYRWEQVIVRPAEVYIAALDSPEKGASL